jgi:DEAD/DEAH box helicase domain-containing protein
LKVVLKDPLTIELNDFLTTRYGGLGVQVVYERVEETREPEPGPSIDELSLPEPLKVALEKRGVKRLYKFQYDAYKRILNGENVIIVAGTGTGKTEAFFIPLAKKILEEERANPRAIILYPTKALARDQVKRFIEYSVYGKMGVGVYDGDTPEDQRRRIASSPPPIIVSNPDMIHVGLIYSPYITKFVHQADIFVFDELHVYEGVLGSHIYNLVHRVKLTKRTKPQFIASSATIGNPKEFAESIFREDFTLVEGSPYRKGTAVHILVSSGHLSRWSVLAVLAKFLVERGLRFIAFVDSQQLAELVGSILESKYGLNIAVHRAGISHEIRRDVERRLREGALSGVIATPTLELGIDIGVIDAVLLASPPATLAKYIQRAGRAGRRRKGYVITVLSDTPIDAYYTRNPTSFFDRELPPSVIETNNEEVAKLHLVSYLLQVGKARLTSLLDEWRRVVDDLIAEGIIRRIGPYVTPNYPVARRFVASKGGIRSPGDRVEIVDSTRAETIGERELPIAILELYPGSIYYYNRRPYIVEKLDLHDKVAYIRPYEAGSDVYTRPLYSVDVADYSVELERETHYGFTAAYAKVLLEVKVVGYVLRDLYSGEVIYTKDLDPPLTYRYATRATIFKLDSPAEFNTLDSAEAFHAIEHAVIEAARLTCGAGLTDLGGVSYPSGDIVVYDAEIGGSGVAKLLYLKLERTIDIAYELMARCNCDDGCPRCIYSPYCGNNNKLLSKRKAIKTLNHLYTMKVRVKTKPLEERFGKPLV